MSFESCCLPDSEYLIEQNVNQAILMRKIKFKIDCSVIILAMKKFKAKNFKIVPSIMQIEN